jgi:glycine/D-amino acid oxidase-like deaminating enzyme
MSDAGAEYVRNAARDMPGVSLNEDGWLHVSKTERASALAHEAAVLAGEFGVAVEPWPADRVGEALNSPSYFHGLHYPRGFSLHPLNYALGLAAAAEANGARIFEDTPVLEIDPAGVRKRVVTADSRIRAAHLVLAGGVHMNELAPQFTDTLLPVFDSVVITAPLGEELAETIRYPGAVSDEIDATGHHHRVIDGRRLLWCGHSAVQLGNPHRQGEALLRQIRHTYPALSGVWAEHAWVGVAGRTVHGMPQIGEITPGLWLLNGFGGHGLNTTAMGGELIARAIVEGDRAWEMFSAFPLVWAGGRFGRMAQQVSGWAGYLKESIGGMLAPRRAPVRPRRETVVATVAAEAVAISSEPILERSQAQPSFLEPVLPPAPPPVVIEPPAVHAQVKEAAESPAASRELVEPAEPPTVQSEPPEPAEPPVAAREFTVPVQPRAPRPEIVERIRTLMGRPEASETEPSPVAEQAPAAAPDTGRESPVDTAETPHVLAEPAIPVQASSTATEAAAPAEPQIVSPETVAPAEPSPVPAEMAEPPVRKRPKRGPKKRKTPRLLDQVAAQGVKVSDAPAAAATPPGSPDAADQTSGPTADKKI